MDKAEYREFKEKILKLFAEAAPKLAAKLKETAVTVPGPASPKV